jgi:type II secretory pathway component PulJ
MIILKNRSHIQVKAFTVLEMLFVMMLSAIVTGLTYMYFTQLSHYLKKSSTSDNTYLNYRMFDFVYKKDLDQSGTIHYNGKDEILLKINDEEITYQIDDESIIREADQTTDTFNFKVSNLEVHELESHKQLVSSIRFDAVFDSINFLTNYYMKEYSSEILYNNYESKKSNGN